MEVVAALNEAGNASGVGAPPSNKISLVYARNRAKIADELKIGDIVERHLSDGDAVLFNR